MELWGVCLQKGMWSCPIFMGDSNHKDDAHLRASRWSGLLHPLSMSRDQMRRAADIAAAVVVSHGSAGLLHALPGGLIWQPVDCVWPAGSS